MSILLVVTRHPSDRLGWRSAVVLFVGTLLFAVSLVAAFAKGLTPRQSNGWIWLPDILGCVCFLVSGHLAMLDVGDGRVRVRARLLSWWIVAVNQFGSVLFFLAGIAAFTRPATSRTWTPHWSTGGPSQARSASRSAGSCRHSTPPTNKNGGRHNHDEAQ